MKTCKNQYSAKSKRRRREKRKMGYYKPRVRMALVEEELGQPIEQLISFYLRLNRSKEITAELLGINPKTLNKWMQILNMGDVG